VTGPEFRVSRDTLFDLLDLGLAHSVDLVHLVTGDVSQGGRAAEEERAAYVLTATRHGRDVLDVAHRLGRLPTSTTGRPHP
jgi:hypothetical protein